MAKRYNKVKDSGKRQSFKTGSIRDTNENKPRYDLITPIGLYRLAMHYANGAKKYGDRNWEKGQPLSRYLESLFRHLIAVEIGLEDEDHISAVIWNMMAYIHTKTMIEAGVLSKKLDDMPKYPDLVKKLILGEITKNG